MLIGFSFIILLLTFKVWCILAVNYSVSSHEMKLVTVLNCHQIVASV